MPSFIYAPGVRIYIDTVKNGIIDVSDDLVNGQVQRRSDGVSSANWSLQNPRRKYDGIFTPMDRVIIMMKRVTWLRVFTGYLNSVPIFSVWPRVINLTSSCTLKRLQYWYWDPSLPASENLVRQALLQGGNDKQRAADGGLKNAVLTLLERVCNWPPQYAHVGEIPDNWFTWSQNILKQSMGEVNAAREAIAAAQGLVGSNGTIGGASVAGTATGSVQPGTYGGMEITSTQAQYAEEIYNVLRAAKASDVDTQVILTFAIANTSLNPDSQSPAPDAVGIYGLTSGYGTQDDRHDVSTATSLIFQRLSALPNHDKMTVTQMARALFPNLDAAAINSMYGVAAALITPMKAQATKGGAGATSAAAPGTTMAGGASSGTAASVSAKTFMQKGVDYVGLSNKAVYTEQFGGTHPEIITADNPPGLDCSSFVQWCYYHATGRVVDHRTVADQVAWCKQANTFKAGKVADGMNTQGALMFNGTQHVGISMGDGQHVVQYGSADNGGAANNVIVNTEWTDSGLAPGLDYNGTYTADPSGGANGNAQSAVDAAKSKVIVTAPPDVPPGATDPIDAMFHGWEWAIQDDGSMSESIGLTGVLAIMNDQPILGYIKNLINSAMRSFCSAPNGDFMAWFPDFYGIWGTAAIMKIEPIELIDFTVDWSDDYMVTHEFVTPVISDTFGLASGTLSNLNSYPELDSIPVTIENPAVMSALFGLEQNDQQTAQFVQFVLNRFGARPQWDQSPGLTGPKTGFFLALYYFMRQWAYQYNANVPITFMPELWPGMLMQIPAYNFQAYCTTVTHSFDFNEGSGFSTTVNIAAPARLDANSNLLMGMPLAGQMSGKRASQASDKLVLPAATTTRGSAGAR